MLYKIRHKSHYLVHVQAEVLTYKINQRLYHTWEDESFLGKLKAIAVRCHGKTVTFRIYQRYLLAFAIFLQEHRRSAGEEEHLPWTQNNINTTLEIIDGVSLCLLVVFRLFHRDEPWEVFTFLGAFYLDAIQRQKLSAERFKQTLGHWGFPKERRWSCGGLQGPQGRRHPTDHFNLFVVFVFFSGSVWNWFSGVSWRNDRFPHVKNFKQHIEIWFYIWITGKTFNEIVTVTPNDTLRKFYRVCPKVSF